MKKVYQYNPNYKSVDLLITLFTFLNNYGFDITNIIVKIYNDSKKTLDYINTKDIANFTIDCNYYLNNYKGTTGYNLFLLNYIELTNRNLQKYENRFVIDLKDLNDIKIKKVNITNNINQSIIDREVNRYMDMINNLLTDYRIKYKESFQIIEKQQNDNDKNAANNYVEANYIIPVDYVYPQIN